MTQIQKGLQHPGRCLIAHPAFESWLQDLADWTHLPEEAKETLSRGLSESLQGRSVQEIADWRDEKLVEILKAVYGKNEI